MIMKQTPFAWLASLFSSKPIAAQGGKATNIGRGSIVRGGDSGDGEPGQVVITDKEGKVIFDSGANPKIPVTNEVVIKTAPEVWLDNLKKNFKNSDLVMMSEIALEKMLDVDHEGWLWANMKGVHERVIFIPSQKNVAILKS
jgi:hypothetical protein